MKYFKQFEVLVDLVFCALCDMEIDYTMTCWKESKNQLWTSIHNT